jgi:hypothetical protein
VVRRGEGRGGHGAKRLIGGAAVCTSWCDLVAGSQGRRAECTAETRVMQRAQAGGASAIVGQVRQRRPNNGSWPGSCGRCAVLGCLAQQSATETERMLGCAERPSNLRTPAGDSGGHWSGAGGCSVEDRTQQRMGRGRGSRRLNERRRERGQRKLEECNNVR